MENKEKELNQISNRLIELREYRLAEKFLDSLVVENKELNDENRDVAYKFEMTKEKITLQEKFINQVVNNKSEIIAESQQKVSDNDATIKTRKEDIVGLEQDKDELSYDAQERARLEGKITKLGKTEAALQNRINRKE